MAEIGKGRLWLTALPTPHNMRVLLRFGEVEQARLRGGSGTPGTEPLRFAILRLGRLPPTLTPILRTCGCFRNSTK